MRACDCLTDTAALQDELPQSMVRKARDMGGERDGVWVYVWQRECCMHEVWAKFARVAGCAHDNPGAEARGIEYTMHAWDAHANAPGT